MSVLGSNAKSAIVIAWSSAAAAAAAGVLVSVEPSVEPSVPSSELQAAISSATANTVASSRNACFRMTPPFVLGTTDGLGVRFPLVLDLSLVSKTPERKRQRQATDPLSWNTGSVGSPTQS